MSQYDCGRNHPRWKKHIEIMVPYHYQSNICCLVWSNRKIKVTLNWRYLKCSHGIFMQFYAISWFCPHQSCHKFEGISRVFTRPDSHCWRSTFDPRKLVSFKLHFGNQMQRLLGWDSKKTCGLLLCIASLGIPQKHMFHHVSNCF